MTNDAHVADARLEPVLLDRRYDGLAESYDARRFENPAGQFNARRDQDILRGLIAQTGAKWVLDVPAGTGRTGQYLQNTGRTVVGCDLSTDMLQIARKKSKTTPLVQADASRLPFASRSVPCLVCLRFFHLFAHRDRFIFMREFHRVVEPGGFLVLSVTNACYGLAVNLIRKWTGHFNVTFFWPGQARSLFSGWETIESCGNYLPLQWRMEQHWPSPLRRAESWLKCSPLRDLCFEKFILLRKSPGGQP